jgi:soluble lytic murein transglycosylase-like protein
MTVQPDRMLNCNANTLSELAKLSFSWPECLTLRKLAAALAATGICVFAHASEKAAETASTYRLRTENPRAFRLIASEPATPTRPVLPDQPYAEQIERAAREASLDPALVHAVIHVESHYNPGARSPKGALGLMQVLPETAKRYGVVDATKSVAANLSVGTRYLRDLMDMFDGRLELVLAAYNAGENAVLRYGYRIPPYRETENYVPAVLAKYRQWQQPVPTVPDRRRIEYLPGTTLDATIRPELRP